MTTENSTVDKEKTTLSIGMRLRVAREARQLTTAEVAGQMRLTEQRIVDIENDDYTKLGGLTYVRGHLRAYCRIVGESADKLLQLFDESGFASVLANQKSERPSMAYQPVSAHVNRQYLRWSAIGLVGILVVILIVWWGHDRQASSAGSVTPSTTLQNGAATSQNANAAGAQSANAHVVQTMPRVAQQVPFHSAGPATTATNSVANGPEKKTIPAPKSSAPAKLNMSGVGFGNG